MGVVPKLFVNLASSLFMAVLAFVVCGASWSVPDAWSQTVLAKNSSTRPIVYLGSVDSNRFRSSQEVECAPTNTSCMAQGSSGSVPGAVKSGYARVLRSQGLTVVESKPSQGTFYEVSLSADINELPSKPPIVPKRFSCNIDGKVSRQGTDQNQKKFMIHKRVGSLEMDAHSGDEGLADRMLVLNCLNHSVRLIRNGIQTMTK